MYRCDVGDGEAVTGNRLWAVDELRWRDAGVRYPRADFKESMRYVVRMVSRYCEMNIKIVEAAANIVSRFRPIDGANGVLARQELPRVRPGSGAHEQLTGEWDSHENPNQTILDVFTAHEIMHALGLIHFNSRPSLMNATLDPQWHEGWDDWTIDELRSRYGRPGTAPVPDCGTWIDRLCAGLWQVPR